MRVEGANQVRRDFADALNSVGQHDEESRRNRPEAPAPRSRLACRRRHLADRHLEYVVRRWAAPRGWRRAVTSTRVSARCRRAEAPTRRRGCEGRLRRACRRTADTSSPRSPSGPSPECWVGGRLDRAHLNDRRSTCVVVSSQIVHADSLSDSGLAMTAGAPGIPKSGPRLALSVLASLTTRGFAALPAIKRGRRQVQDRMQCVADADIECAGFTGHDDRGIAHRGVRPEERQDRAHRDDDGRQNAARDERERLCPHRIVQHADVSAQQRVLHPAHQKSVPADLQPGRRLTSHNPPAPSLVALRCTAFHQFRSSRNDIPAGVFSNFPCTDFRFAVSPPSRRRLRRSCRPCRAPSSPCPRRP